MTGVQTCALPIFEKKYDYVICGHIHEPKYEFRSTSKGGTTYLNSGDWIENLSALEYNKQKWSIYKYDKNYFKNNLIEDLIENDNQLAENLLEQIKK